MQQRFMEGQLRQSKDYVATQVSTDKIKAAMGINSGVKYDQGKARYDLVPILAEEEIANVFTYGANKYNEDYEEENWRKLDHQARRLYSAARRHMQAVSKGEHYDKESGLHHYAHACSNLMMLMQLHLEIDTEV